MNREQLEAVALEFKRLARERLPGDALFALVMGTPASKGFVVATSVAPESIQEFWGLLAGQAPRVVDLRPEASGEVGNG